MKGIRSKVPRASIANLMLLNATVALNWVLFARYNDGTMDDEREVLSVFVILNILAFALAYKHKRRWSFLVGFEIAGSVVVAVTFGMCWYLPELVEEIFDAVVYPLVALTVKRVTTCLPLAVRNDISNQRIYVALPIYLIFGPLITAPITIVQLLISVAGGLVSQKIANAVTSAGVRRLSKEPPIYHPGSTDTKSDLGS